MWAGRRALDAQDDGASAQIERQDAILEVTVTPKTRKPSVCDGHEANNADPSFALASSTQTFRSSRLRLDGSQTVLMRQSIVASSAENAGWARSASAFLASPSSVPAAAVSSASCADCARPALLRSS